MIIMKIQLFYLKFLQEDWETESKFRVSKINIFSKFLSPRIVLVAKRKYQLHSMVSSFNWFHRYSWMIHIGNILVWEEVLFHENFGKNFWTTLVGLLRSRKKTLFAVCDDAISSHFELESKAIQHPKIHSIRNLWWKFNPI